jgi:hypothetical protein
LLPESCNRANWSIVGKRDESSSVEGPGLESNAAKGSLETTRKGEGLGLALGCG